MWKKLVFETVANSRSRMFLTPWSRSRLKKKNTRTWSRMGRKSGTGAAWKKNPEPEPPKNDPTHKLWFQTSSAESVRLPLYARTQKSWNTYGKVEHWIIMVYLNLNYTCRHTQKRISRKCQRVPDPIGALRATKTLETSNLWLFLEPSGEGPRGFQRVPGVPSCSITYISVIQEVFF